MKNKISVIVPVYNVESYLPRCIDSILNQTYNNFEIILVNDGSSDNSGNICDEYKSLDNRIIVIHKSNEGSSGARNTGLDVANGDYIAFVDSDDHIDKQMFEKMLFYVSKHDLEVIEISPKYSNSNQVLDNTFVREDTITATKRILKSTAFSVWRRLYKRTSIECMRFIPGIIHQDVFYTIDLMNQVSRLGYLNSALYYYNTENESIIRSKYSLKKIETAISATQYIKKNVVEHPEVKKALKNYITYYYTDHYFLLSRNTRIDQDGGFRRILKKEIINSLTLSNINLRSLLVVILHPKLMELVSSSYQTLTSK